MIDYTKIGAIKTKTGFDAGLRDYMLKIYNYMALALLLTGLMAVGTLNFPPLMQIMYELGPNQEILSVTTLGMIITWSPLLIALYFFMGFGNMTKSTANTLFWLYAALVGMSLSSLGLMYTGQSLAKTFFICSSVFGSMSLYGYTTKRDLTSMGSFLVMGLIGLIIVSIVNIFMQSPAIQFATSFIGVAIFMGLTAWDTQKLKSMYYYYGNDDKMAIMGAFNLYLDFINLFLYLLRFFGDRKN